MWGFNWKIYFERNQIENMITFKGYIYPLSFFDIVLTSSLVSNLRILAVSPSHGKRSKEKPLILLILFSKKK
jgi:hypothetical protein